MMGKAYQITTHGFTVVIQRLKITPKLKKGKGYKYSKLPKDISTSMKHLE